MTESTKATRATVTIGDLTIEGFMLPDGSYQMSQTQAAESVGLAPQNASDFLRSKAFKSSVGEGYTVPISEIESLETQGRGGSRIVALPLAVVGKYWLYQVSKGNKKAIALVDALITESLERRFDDAFGVSRTEQERNDRLSGRVQQLERDLTELGDAYSSDEIARLELEAYRDENRRLRDALDERGIDFK
jgi:hypothetical protein